MNSALHFDQSLTQNNPFQAALDARNRSNNTNNTSDASFKSEELSFLADKIWYLTWGVIFIVGLLIFKPWQKSFNEQLGFTQKEIVQKLENNNNENVLAAISALNNKDIYTAKLILGKQYAQNPDNAQLAYNYALVLMGDNKTETIKEILTPFAKGSGAYKDKASYILALCYLKEKSVSMSKQWLNQISKQSANYAQALVLFSVLEKA
jgi:hypothetical protein